MQQFQLDSVDPSRKLFATTARLSGGQMLVQILHGRRTIQVVVGRNHASEQITLACSCGARRRCAHAEFAVESLHKHHGARAWLEGNAPAPDAHALPLLRPPAPPPESPAEREGRKIEAWVQELQRTRDRPPPNAPEPGKEKVALFFCTPSKDSGGLELTVWLGQKKKTGGYSRIRQLDLAKTLKGSAHLSPGDLGLLAALRGHSSDGWRTTITLRDGAHGIVRALVNTGRLLLEGAEPASIAAGDRRRGRLAWRTTDDGSQHPDLEVEGGGSALLFDEPMYLAAAPAQIGPLACDVPIQIIRGFLDGDAVSAEMSASLTPAVRTLLRDLGLPEPRPLIVEPTPIAPPRPRLVLYTHEVAAGYFLDSVILDGAHLRFAYGTREFAASDRVTEFRHVEGDRVIASKRDLDAEAQALARLHALGFRALADTLRGQDWHAVRYELQQVGSADDLTLNARVRPPDPERWQAFLRDGRSQLQAAGWRVDIDPSFRHATLQASKWFVHTQPAGGDWFELDVGIEVGDERVALMPVLLHMLQELDPAEFLGPAKTKDTEVAIDLPDGRRILVSAHRVQTMLRALLELQAGGKIEGDKLRLRRLLAPQVLALEDGSGHVEWQDQGALRALAHKLRDFEAVASVDLPPTVHADLRSYQHEGVAWLQFLRAHDLGGILADDMGLGKTVQALAHVAVEKAAGRLDRPCLVVSPTSVVNNWAAEAQRFTPDLRLLVLHGAGRAAALQRLADYDLVLTTYPLVPRDLDSLRAQPFHLLIADEAQAIKNARAKVSQALREIDTRHRLCLTGTPLENHLGELWAQFDFLMPGVLGDARAFGRVFRTPIEKVGDRARQQALAARIRPFILRRSKTAVARELPPKTQIVHAVELEGAQRDLYETIRLSVHERVRQTIAEKGIEQAQIIILDALLKLRQVCCDPRLVKLDAAHGVTDSAKLDALFDLLPSLVAEGRRILLFSQFTSMLALIEAAMREREIAFVKLTGDTKDRKTPVARFQAGEVPVFLISLKAGGTGLNLVAADTVIHYDPWWNPAAEQQATDRAHRIGQDKPVFVYKLIAKGTVEERIGRLQERKRALAAGVLDGSDRQGAALTRSDVDALFAALSD